MPRVYGYTVINLGAVRRARLQDNTGDQCTLARTDLLVNMGSSSCAVDQNETKASFLES